MSELQRIRKKQELIDLAKELGVRRDWHEPDEQGLTAITFGRYFDNAGHWGLAQLSRRELDARMRLDKTGDTNTVEDYTVEDVARFIEIFVVLYREGRAVAEVNLATLFAFACGTTD